VKPDAPGLVPYVRRQVFEAEGMIARDHPKGGSLSLETPGVGPRGTFRTARLFWKFIFWLGDAKPSEADLQITKRVAKGGASYVTPEAILELIPACSWFPGHP
jgi:hypothetical protein